MSGQASRDRGGRIQLSAAALSLAVVLAIGWTVTPEDLRGLVLLVAGAVVAVTYVGLYALQRSRHW